MPKEPRNTKRTGELSEAAFLHKAVSLGFKVTKPWGDSERYDFVVDSGGRMWRVQIKCTAAIHAGGYHIQPIHFVYGERKVVYTDAEIDVLAAHIVPLDVWYVVPVQAIAAGTVSGYIPTVVAKVPASKSTARPGIFFEAADAMLAPLRFLLIRRRAKRVKKMPKNQRRNGPCGGRSGGLGFLVAVK